MAKEQEEIPNPTKHLETSPQNASIDISLERSNLKHTLPPKKQSSETALYNEKLMQYVPAAEKVIKDETKPVWEKLKANIYVALATNSIIKPPYEGDKDNERSYFTTGPRGIGRKVDGQDFPDVTFDLMKESGDRPSAGLKRSINQTNFKDFPTDEASINAFSQIYAGMCASRINSREGFCNPVIEQEAMTKALIELFKTNSKDFVAKSSEYLFEMGKEVANPRTNSEVDPTAKPTNIPLCAPIYTRKEYENIKKGLTNNLFKACGLSMQENEALTIPVTIENTTDITASNQVKNNAASKEVQNESKEVKAEPKVKENFITRLKNLFLGTKESAEATQKQATAIKTKESAAKNPAGKSLMDKFKELFSWGKKKDTVLTEPNVPATPKAEVNKAKEQTPAVNQERTQSPNSIFGAVDNVNLGTKSPPNTPAPPSTQKQTGRGA
jgi:hypothetical protein